MFPFPSLIFCSFVQEPNACNRLFCNVIWSGPCNSSFSNSSLEQRIWARWMRRSLCPSSTCLSAFLSANVAASLWLTAWPCSCWQLRLLPQDNISPPHFSLHLSSPPHPTPSSSPPLSYSPPFSTSFPLLPPYSSRDTNSQVPSICVYVSN